MLLSWKFSFLLTTFFIGTNSFQRVCYLISSDPKLLIPPDQLKWPLCTHLIFSFANVNDDQMDVNNVMANYMEKMVDANQTQVQYLISLSGERMDFVQNNTKLQRFIDSTIAIIDRYKLHGLDIDWEFPTHQKLEFIHLLKTIRYRFRKRMNYRGEPYLLTVALTPIIYIVELSYDIKSIRNYVDFVNLMTYDFHSPNTLSYTNFNSPLYPNPLDKLYFHYFNIEYSVYYMKSLGLPLSKIMIGIPFYGYRYFLVNERFHGLYAMSNGTEEAVKFNELYEFLNDPDTTRIFDRDSKVPYSYRGKEWVTYDDEESVAIKAQWIMDQGLGGSMSFALNYDYNSDLNDRQFCLQTILYDILK